MPAGTNIDRFISILVNPLSGKGKAIRVGERISDLLKAKGISHLMFAGDWPAGLDRFTEAWVVGGDGTINYFINLYKPVTIPIVLFRGGTGNDFAWKLYGDMSVDEQVELVLQTEPAPVDAALCNDKLYLNSLGIGFDGRVLGSIHNIRWMGGHLGYWLAALWNIFSFRESAYEVQTETQMFKGRFLLVVINNSSRTGGGFMISPRASVSDGQLDLVLCQPLSIFKRLQYMPLIQKGGHLDRGFIQFSHQKQVTVYCEKETPAALDGELLLAKEFRIQVVPGCLLFRYLPVG